MNDNIFLIGFMGTGKSSVASVLVEKTGKEMVEMDELIAAEQGMSITDIFSQYGEDYFRELETELLRQLRLEGGKVVSCGGGAVIKPENIEIMKQNGSIICLEASPSTVYQRVKNSENRPILNGNMNVEFIAELINKRKDKYLDAADIVIVTDNRSMDEICDEIIAKCNL